jgi:Uma2 family endonuclease
MTEVLSLNTVPLPVRLRAADYRLLDESGAFEAYGKTELLAGEIVYMNAQYRPRGRVKMALYQALSDGLRAIHSVYAVAVEVSVSLSEHDAPQPDLTLTSEPDGEGFIPARSVGLIVEVADATLRSDMTRKAAIYARAGIPEYWVADVNGRAIHPMWHPLAGAYAERSTTDFGQPVNAATISGLTVATAGL